MNQRPRNISLFWYLLAAIAIFLVVAAEGLRWGQTGVYTRTLLHSTEAVDRQDAAKWLGMRGSRSRDAVPALIEAVRDSDADVRRQAVWALGQVAQDLHATVPRLVWTLEDVAEHTEVRVEAAKALAAIGPPAGHDATPVLLLIARNSGEDRELRFTAIVSLGAMGAEAKTAVSDLVSLLLMHEAESMYAPVQMAITRMGADAVPVLVELLQHDSPAMRTHAALALGWLGPQADAALPALQAALGDSDESVREQAALAIRSIESRDAQR